MTRSVLTAEKFQIGAGLSGYVAELSSAFLCAALGFQHEHDSAAYIGHWVDVMKADNRAIFYAASHASHAADWLLECEQADTDKVAAE